jgi:hypothetical protein
MFAVSNDVAADWHKYLKVTDAFRCLCPQNPKSLYSGEGAIPGSHMSEVSSDFRVLA